MIYRSRLAIILVFILALLFPVLVYSQQPAQPGQARFEKSPVFSKSTRVCFKNGCCYYATVEQGTGVVTNLVGDPATPVETTFIGEPKACVAHTKASCEADLGVEFCGVGTIQLPPIQKDKGGTCFYPPNIMFPC